MSERLVHLLIASVLLTGGLSFAQAVHETTVSDIIRMSQAGVGDETILTFLLAKESLIELTAEDVVALSDAGVSEYLINALIELMGPSLPLVVEGPPVEAYPLGAQYPASFYVSYYHEPWFYPALFYHDFFFETHGHDHHRGHHSRSGHHTRAHHHDEDHVIVGHHKDVYLAHRGAPAAHRFGRGHVGRHGSIPSAHTGRSHSVSHHQARQPVLGQSIRHPGARGRHDDSRIARVVGQRRQLSYRRVGPRHSTRRFSAPGLRQSARISRNTGQRNQVSHHRVGHTRNSTHHVKASGGHNRVRVSGGHAGGGHRAVHSRGRHTGRHGGRR